MFLYKNRSFFYEYIKICEVITFYSIRRVEVQGNAGLDEYIVSGVSRK